METLKNGNQYYKMNLNKNNFKESLNNNIHHYVDFLFLTLLFSFTLFKVPIFEKYINIREISFVILFSIWGLFKILVIKKLAFRISFYDVFILTLFFILLVHFYTFSEATFYYSRFWVYLFGFFALFLFKRMFESYGTIKFRYTLFLLAFLTLIQSSLALLQYFGFIEGNREYFNILGSFTSPNFLGLYLVFGLIIFAWHLGLRRSKNKWTSFAGIFFFLTLLTVLIFTGSRGSWIALLSALFVLILTSRKSLEVLKSLPLVKKIIIVAVLFIGICLLGQYMYVQNTESISGRALIAKITSNEIMDKPLFGHGLFSFSSGYNSAKADYFLSQERDWLEVKVANYVSTAFNDYLLIGYELGIPFLVFFIMAIIVLFFKTKVNSKTRVAMSLLTSIGVWSLFNSVLSTPTFILIIAFSLAILWEYGINPKKLILLSKGLSKFLVFILIILSCLGLYLVGSKLYAANKFERNLKNPKWVNRATLSDIKTLAALLNNNTTSDFNIGRILLKAGYKKEGFQFMESSFDNTLKPDIGRKLATSYLEEGNFSRANEIYELNAGIEPFRYEPLVNLMNIQENVNDYQKLISLAQKVVELPVKIPSVKVDKYKKLAKKKISYYSKRVDTISRLKGTLSKTLFFKSDVLEKKLVYKVYLPPLSMIDEKLPVVYINDGRAYTKNGTVDILDSLIANSKTRPAAAVFLEPRDGYQKYKNVRQELFLCNTDFVDFFSKEFIPQIEHHYRVGGERNKRTIMGRSFGGLAAAFLANKEPELFKNIVMQSPAFHPCPEIYKMFPNSADTDFKIYLSYGTGKDTERQSLKMKIDLTQKGYTFELDVVKGGNHNWKLWKPQLKNIFKYLYTDDNFK